MTPRHENNCSVPAHVLDCFGFGIILLGGDGRPTVINAVAATLMGPACLYNDGTGALRSSHTQLDTAIRAPIRGLGEGVVRVEPESGQPVTVWVRPPGDESRARDTGIDKSIFIMSAASPSLSAEVLARMLGITQAEARVVHALLAGKSLMDCARETSLALNTVRNQLRSVLAKTGAGTQTELLLMIQRLVPPLHFA